MPQIFAEPRPGAAIYADHMPGHNAAAIAQPRARNGDSLGCDLFDGIAPAGRGLSFLDSTVLDPPARVACWGCSCSMSVRSTLATIMICPACEAQAGGTTIEERRALLGSDSRAALWRSILARRSTARIHPIQHAPPAYAMATASGDVARWAARPAPCIAVLHGRTGRGKTWQAWGAIRIIGGKMIAGHDLARADAPIEDLMAYRGLLVIDDLAARATPGAIAAATRLIDARQAWQRLTMITTNLDGESMADIDPRLASRLAGAELIEIAGPDRRRA